MNDDEKEVFSYQEQIEPYSRLSCQLIIQKDEGEIEIITPKYIDKYFKNKYHDLDDESSDDDE